MSPFVSRTSFTFACAARRVLLAASFAVGLSGDGGCQDSAAYDPLRVTDTARGSTVSLTVHDTARARDLPVRVYLPVASNAAPVVLFSHGLGGSCENNPYLGNHWSARGYVVVFVQHPGSDEAVWHDVPVHERRAVMARAASLENLKHRIADVVATLDALTAWHAAPGHVLSNRLDLTRIGMSGHSFGALTAQAVSGQRLPLGMQNVTDPRIKAALMMSPSAPRRGRVETAFGAVAVPWLLMTGTKDDSLIGNADAASRLKVFDALPPGSHCELVLDNAEHSAFGDRALPGDREPRNPNHHRAILALSTAFWDTHLRGDGAARDWLTGDGPRKVLEKADRWQRK